MSAFNSSAFNSNAFDVGSTTHTYSVSPSGGLVASGTALAARGAVRSASGGLSFLGSATTLARQSRTIVTSAFIALAGTSPLVRNNQITASGGFLLSGTSLLLRTGDTLGMVLGAINDVVFQKLRLMGLFGSRNDMLNENTFWRGLAGGNTTNPLNDIKSVVLRGLGFSGQVNDMEKKYWENK